MQTRVLIPVADGSEDIETVTLIDVLRRAEFDVTVASVHDRREIVAARQTRLVADALIDEVVARTFDLIVCPGGMPGAAHLRDSATLRNLLLAQRDSGRLLAAICAAPAVVFAHHGLLDGVPATAHPAFQEQLPQLEANRCVVEDKQIITSQGPGTALEFALALVARLGGEQLRATVAAPMVVEQF